MQDSERTTRPLSSAVRVIAGLLFALIAATSPWWLTHGAFLPVTQRAVTLSQRAVELSQQLFSAQTVSPTDAAEITPETTVSETAATEATTVTTTETTTKTTTGTTTETAADSSTLRPVRETQIGGSGTSAGGIYVRNGAGYDLDIEDALSQKAKCKILLNAGYQVLIIHTHTTECYAQEDSDTYDTTFSPRSTDKSLNMVAVGDIVAQKLEDAGIRTLHVTTIHDYPKYNGSYDRAAETIADYLEKYPSIEMVIDIHRDSVTQDDGTKIKPTVTINGKKAAQIMIITGCDNYGRLDFPEWELNLRMAAQVQRQASSDWEGLMRPLYFAPFRYNMHLTPNSLLVEFGTDVNTLDEAEYAAEMFGESLAKVLLGYKVKPKS